MKRYWWASPLSSVASSISQHSTAYRELKRLRKLRESLRGTPTKLPKELHQKGVPSERVDPLTQHLDDSDLYWSSQPL